MPKPDGPQFHFIYEQNPEDETERHSIVAVPEGESTTAGLMIWSGPEGADTGHLQSIEVKPQYRRRGVATQMWRYAQGLAQENPDIHMPVHSVLRTTQGDRWAQSTGDWLPENQYRK